MSGRSSPFISSWGEEWLAYCFEYPSDYSDEGGISYIASQMPSPPPRSSSPPILSPIAPGIPADKAQGFGDAKAKAAASEQMRGVLAPAGAEEGDGQRAIGVDKLTLSVDRLATSPDMQQKQHPPSLVRPSLARGPSLLSEIMSEMSTTGARSSGMSFDSGTSATKASAVPMSPMMSPNLSSASTKVSPGTVSDEKASTSAKPAKQSATSPPVALHRARLTRASTSGSTDSQNTSRTRPRPMSRKSSANSVSIVIGVRSPVSGNESLSRQASTSSLKRSTSALGNPPDMRLPSPPPQRSASAMTIRKTPSGSTHSTLLPSVASAGSVPSRDVVTATPSTIPARAAGQRKLPKPTRLYFKDAVTFVSQLVQALLLLWVQVVRPLVRLTLCVVMSACAKLSRRSKRDIRPVIGDTKPSPDEACVPFAERFKYLMCTSPLLSKTLSISTYAAHKPEIASTPAFEKFEQAFVRDKGITYPKSEAMQVNVAGRIDGGATQSTVFGDTPMREIAGISLTRLGETTCLSAIASLAALLFVSPDLRTWARTALLMVSLVLVGVAVAGVQSIEAIRFELTHKPVGAYTLSSLDRRKQSRKAATIFLSPSSQKRVADAVCSTTSQLLKSAADFDIACNSAVSAIQEVELVSRGYKLTHPMPPISRIEAASLGRGNGPGPFRAGRAARSSWQPGVYPTTPRSPMLPVGRIGSLKLQPSSPSFASALSPGAEIRDHNTSSRANSMRSSHTSELRMLQLRKALGTTFEEATYALQSVLDELTPCLDQQEWKLLREMYELDAQTPPRSLHQELSVSTESTAQSTLPDLSISQCDRATSPLDETDVSSRANTPHRRTLSLLEDHFPPNCSVDRKRTSIIASPILGPQSPTSPVRRARTRLSYISDRTPASNPAIGPNQTSAQKRLSYIKTPAAPSPTPSRVVSIGSRPQPVYPLRGRASAPRDDPSQSSVRDLPSPGSPRRESIQEDASSHLRLASLKSSFESLHAIRRSLLCCLMALDFSLQRKIDSPARGKRSFIVYWADINTKLERLATTFDGLGTDIKSQVRQEMGFGLDESASQDTAPATAGHSENGSKGLKGSDSSVSSDDGVTDRMQAMIQAMRSVQAKLRVCSEDLQSKVNAAALHGFETDGADRAVSPLSSPALTAASTIPEAERTFETIRDDLLSLSAEWEGGLKIMRARRLGQATSSVQSSSRLNSVDQAYVASVSSPMVSLQEDEEDAMRRWIQERGEGQDAADASASEAIERQLAQWSMQEAKSTGLAANGSTEQDELSALLLRSTSPQHLPPPGLEEVYQAEKMPISPRSNGTAKPTREERIRLLQEQRAAKAQEKEVNGTSLSPRQASDGMMRELQTVMHNRKATLFGADAGQ